MSSLQENEIPPLTESDLFVRQSDENLERFDPQRITDALVRETSLDLELAHQIALEVKEQIQRSGIRALTAPLIRGLVDAKLLERGLFEQYRLHTRLGVPAFDADRIIQSLSRDPGVLHGPEGSSLELGEAIKREYAILHVFSEAVSSAHLTGDLHIENIGDVDRPTTMIGSIDFIKRHGVRLPGGFAGSRPAKRADVLALHLVTYTAALQGYFSEALAWDSVNFALAPTLVGLNQREIKQVAQGLLFELSAPAIARGGQPVRCDLHLDWDAPAYLRDQPAVGVGGEKSGVNYGAMNELARAFLTALLEVYLEGDGQGLPFTGPRPVLHLTENFIENQGNRAFLDLVIRVATERGGLVLAFDRLNPEEIGASFTARYGVNSDKLQRAGESWQWRAATFSSVAINLPRVGFKAEGNQARVFELLTELLELAAQASLEKRVFLEKLLARGESGALAMLAMRPDKEPFLPLSWTAHAICPVGLAEMVHTIIGTSLHSTSDAQGEAHAFAASIVSHLHAETERLSAKHKVRFRLSESHDGVGPHRLARLDLLRFGSPLVSFARGEEGAVVDQNQVFYTNSVQLPAQARLDDFEKVFLEGDLTAGLIQGAACNIWLGASVPAAEDVAMLITHALRQTRASAIALCPEFTLCNVCHTFSRGLQKTCSQCGSDRVDGLALYANRFSRTSNWPAWKLDELHRRNRE
ncbi:MAG: anaerobic ribonucleoside-triphosphate reductase [Blastocatellia bacterium]|nr:anaerobic ribonucleoside-triphosphate reductase [Blastocatellia bacterium]